MKLCVLGGGSIHTPALIEALGERKWDRFSEVALFGRDEDRLSVVGRFCRLRATRHSLSCKITWTTDAAKAAEGSAFVLNQVRAGGAQAATEDRRRLAASGIVAHAASYSEIIRVAPVLEEVLPVIQRSSPHALFVNFSNPVSAICELVASNTDLVQVGLCYHTSLAREDFARFIDSSIERLHIETLGINHVSFVTGVAANGQNMSGRVLDHISRFRLKEYNYDAVEEVGAIPISHAYSLFHPGEVWYVRQAGIRQSAADAVLRLTGVDLSDSRREKRRRARHFLRISMQDESATEGLVSDAPWYRKTIVPFLFDYLEGPGGEHTLTVADPGAQDVLERRTAEFSCVVREGTIRPIPGSANLPDRVLELLRRAVQSEAQFLQAIQRRQFDQAVDALVLHPNVASRRHAEKFLKNYFPSPAH